MTTFFAGDELAAADLSDMEAEVDNLLATRAAFLSTAITPLVSAANTDTQILSLSYDFKSGYAYRITAWARAQLNGSPTTASPFFKLRRASASGTTIHDPGSAVVPGGTGFVSGGVASCIVKCTVANTTQTISFTGAYSNAGATSMDIEASSTARAYIVIEPIGLASNYSGALEVPTS